MPDPNKNHHSSAGDYINEDDDMLYHKPVEEEKQKRKPRIVTATGIESFDCRYINIDKAKRDDLIRTLRDGVFRDLETGKAGERHLEYCKYIASSELRLAIELFIIEWYDLQEKKLRDWK